MPLCSPEGLGAKPATLAADVGLTADMVVMRAGA
jgi:hypothetical protein